LGAVDQPSGFGKPFGIGNGNECSEKIDVQVHNDQIFGLRKADRQMLGVGRPDASEYFNDQQ
jgi:hypothetical protein